MAEMPPAFEWEEVKGIDPLNLQEYEKDHLDEIIGMFLSVTAHLRSPRNVNFHIFSDTQHRLRMKDADTNVSLVLKYILLSPKNNNKNIVNLFSFYICKEKSKGKRS